MKLIESLLDLLFPPKCPLCGRVVEQCGICPDCQRTLPWRETPCEERDGVLCAAPLWYEGKVRQAMLRLKFHGASAAAKPLGRLLARCAAEELGGEFDVVTWVPVSPKRLRKRGYDQAELLARAACQMWGTRPERLLRKAVHNTAQSGLHDAAARAENVRDVYRPLGDIKGRRVLLIDDIRTTGSTLSSCIQVLRQAGAAQVVCASVAQTPHHGKEVSLTEDGESALTP